MTSGAQRASLPCGDGAVARIAVSDNGLGIPEAEQGDLFTRFFRPSTAREHHIQGTGLGLAIVESTVR
ncbi:MAG: ATP-binding protein [Ornithinimicrobium sp.]